MRLMYIRVHHCVRHLVFFCCKHEWCSVVVITFVHPKHHDEVPDYPRMLSNGNCHVQGVRVLVSAVRRGERVIEKCTGGESQTHFLLHIFLTFQRCGCWVSSQLGQCLAPQLLHVEVALLQSPVS